MAYIQKVLSEDEKLLALAHVHWFYAFQGFLWFLAPLAIWAGVEMYVFFSPEWARAPMIEASFEARFWIFLALGIGGFFIFLLSVMHIWHTEVALTDRRIIYKHHWIAVDIQETDLEEIKAAHIDSDWLGRFLDYGHIHLDARFVGNMQIYSVAHAYEFVRRLNKAREVVRKNSMKVVLDHGRAESAEKVHIVHHEAPAEYALQVDTHLSPLKRKRLHDRVLESFGLTNFKIKN